MLRGKHKTDSTRRKVVERTPRVGLNEQSLPRVVEQDGLALTAIVECHMERAAQRNDQLLQTLMSMSATTLSGRHIIDPIGTFDFKRNLIGPFGNRQIASGVDNFRQINQFNV